MRRKRSTLLATALTVTLGQSPCFAELEVQRELYTRTEDALRADDRNAFRRGLRRLEDYPLYPYLIRDDLLSRLDEGSGQEVDAFLAAFAGKPFVPPLRRAWLENRAKARDWSTYREVYRDGLGAQFDCWAAEAVYRSGARKRGLAQAAELWNHGRSRPEACDPIFSLLVQDQGITGEMAWRRIERAMELGELRLVRYLRRFVPQTERHEVDRWTSAQRNPQTVLNTYGIPPQWPRSGVMVMQLLRRWSRHDSPAAAEALDRLRKRYELPAGELSALEQYIALSLAQRGDERALLRLNAIPAAQQTNHILEWRARVFMRDGSWEELAEAIGAMPAELGESLRWRYWLARSLNEVGREEQAEQIFREIAEERDYHGFLAAKRFNLPYRLRHQTLEVDESVLESLAAQPPVLRARELFSLERPGAARLEWRHALANPSPETLRAAARLASSWGWHSEAIATVARTGEWDDLELRFPIVHERAISSAASSQRLDPAWIFGIARQESMFREDARSAAGALGLMQLMPTTARLVAAQTDLTLQNRTRLLEPELNIRLGSRYLRLTLDRFEGNALLATAAYNAGPHRVEKWLPKETTVQADVWVETIPFTETRRYVRRVMEYSVVYASRLDSEPEFFAKQIVPIEPPENR